MNGPITRQHQRIIQPLGAIALVLSTAFFSMSGQAATPNAKADNTEVNERDADSNSLTPLDQSNSKADTEIVANIRSALTSDKSLSVYAQNVKVIVRNGAVTLRGPVATAAEKTRVESWAKSVAGVRTVQSEIDIKN
jgi:osmotically-inducible protein OsmY